MTENPIRPTPNLSPPPSKSDLFQLSLSSSISTPPSTLDPRVSLRSWGNHLPSRSEEEEEGQTLRQVRESEGRFKRLERLREVFDSIPIPPSILLPPSPEIKDKKLLPELLIDHEKLPEELERENGAVIAVGVLEEEKDRWERERGVYMKELWKKCGAEVSSSVGSNSNSNSNSNPNSNSITTNPSSIPLKPPSSSMKPPPTTNCLRWSSFETYADSQESALFSIFTSIDSDHDLKLTPLELSQAFKRAGVDVGESVVEGFVRDVDRDGDGLIGWEEWRDFLIVRQLTRTLYKGDPSRLLGLT